MTRQITANGRTLSISLRSDEKIGLLKDGGILIHDFGGASMRSGKRSNSFTLVFEFDRANLALIFEEECEDHVSSQDPPTDPTMTDVPVQLTNSKMTLQLTQDQIDQIVSLYGVIYIRTENGQTVATFGDASYIYVRFFNRFPR